MAHQHRDRIHHCRSLVVWESVLKPHWIFRFRLHCGLSALSEMGRRSRSSSHDLFLWRDVAQAVGGTLSKQQQLALWTVLLVRSLFLQNTWFFLLGMCLFLPDLLCVCHWAREFPCGEYSFRRPHQEEAILVAMCLAYVGRHVSSSLCLEVCGRGACWFARHVSVSSSLVVCRRYMIIAVLSLYQAPGTLRPRPLPFP